MTSSYKSSVAVVRIAIFIVTSIRRQRGDMCSCPEKRSVPVSHCCTQEHICMHTRAETCIHTYTHTCRSAWTTARVEGFQNKAKGFRVCQPKTNRKQINLKKAAKDWGLRQKRPQERDLASSTGEYIVRSSEAPRTYQPATVCLFSCGTGSCIGRLCYTIIECVLCDTNQGIHTIHIGPFRQ